MEEADSIIVKYTWRSKVFREYNDGLYTKTKTLYGWYAPYTTVYLGSPDGYLHTLIIKGPKSNVKAFLASLEDLVSTEVIRGEEYD